MTTARTSWRQPSPPSPPSSSGTRTPHACSRFRAVPRSTSRKRPSAFLPSFLLGHGPLSLEAAALATGLVAACAVWCAWAWSLTHGNPERQGEEHGSARWGTVREGRRFMNLEDPDRNIVLTKHFGMAMDRPDHDRRFERNRNVLVVGGSGSGKTRGFFEPNIMQLNSNHLVTDPKGETLPRMGHMWRGDGRGSVPGWARRPRQQALLVRGRPPLRERRCP